MTLDVSIRCILQKMIDMARKTANLMTIGEVAKTVGIASTALRFYERDGLLTPSSRSKSGYRLYDNDSLERLRFIRAAQSIGFTLDDIRTLLQLDEKTSCSDVQKLIETRLQEIDTKLADITRVRETLADALDRCHKSNTGCAVVADLNKTSRGISTSSH